MLPTLHGGPPRRPEREDEPGGRDETGKNGCFSGFVGHFACLDDCGIRTTLGLWLRYARAVRDDLGEVGSILGR